MAVCLRWGLKRTLLLEMKPGGSGRPDVVFEICFDGLLSRCTHSGTERYFSCIAAIVMDEMMIKNEK
jgi:hypothetical protein